MALRGLQRAPAGKAVLGALMLCLGAALSACNTTYGIPAIGPLSKRDAKPAVVVPAAQARFAFQPISGVPSEQVAKLTTGLNEEAHKRSIVLVPEGDSSATYRVNGYLSAVGGPSGAIMVYVWDIVDANGTRLHRISGQEPSTGGAPDPWAGISDATLRLVAQRTIDSMAGWVRRER